jgi:hypothetical protein
MSKGKNPFQIEENFVAYTKGILNSPALRALCPLATKALHAFEAELLNGQRNGELKVPRDKILEWMNYGSKRGIAGPLEQLYILGFMRPTGRRTVRLTYVHRDVPPTDEWKQFETLDQALLAIGEKPRQPQSSEFDTNLKDGTWPTKPKHKKRPSQNTVIH